MNEKERKEATFIETQRLKQRKDGWEERRQAIDIETERLKSKEVRKEGRKEGNI